MDNQLKNTNEPDINTGYQGYSSDAPTDQVSTERSIERDLSLQEYETDRDAILLAIKDALKERRYDEAQEFVYKYRAAAKTDENFAILAKLVKQGIENNQKIAKIETVLDATPENDYDVRMALCQKILRIQPDNEQYLAEMNRCREAKGLDPLDANGRAPLVPSKVKSGIKQGVSTSAFAALAVINIIELIIFGAAMGESVAAGIIVAELAIHGFTLLPSSIASQPSGKVASRIAGNAVLMLIALAVCIFLHAMA